MKARLLMLQKKTIIFLIVSKYHIYNIMMVVKKISIIFKACFSCKFIDLIRSDEWEKWSEIKK